MEPVSSCVRSFEPLPSHHPSMTTQREFEGQRVVVLGSSSGIGRAVALALAEAGARVVVHGNRRGSEAEAVARQCAARSGTEARVILADLASPEASDQLVDQAWNLWDGIDAWLQLAGADTLTGAAARLTFDEKLELLWNVDVLSTIRVCREVGRRMRARGRGAIVTMGWDQAETGMEGDSGELFAATKGAVMAFTRSLALSLAPQVRVNGVAPGWIRTAWGEGASEVWQERVLRETPAARWGNPDDVAEACRFLASPRSSFITGQIIRVNGGAVR